MRGYLHQHQRERNWRLFFMTLLWLGLILAIIPTAFFNWSKTEPTSALPASNARCFFNMNTAHALFNETACFSPVDNSRSYNSDDICIKSPFWQTSALQAAVVSIVLLGLGFCTRSVKLIKSFSYRVQSSVRQNTSRRFHAKLTSLRRRGPDVSNIPEVKRHRLKFLAIAAVYLVGKLYADLLTSEASDVYWLVVSAIWGTIRFRTAQSSATVSDNEWGFGQILPVFLLVGPIIATIESLAPKQQGEQGNSRSCVYSQENNEAAGDDGSLNPLHKIL
ncbi:hypothetical protein QQS21_009948 [Conoideocrella luteorostrata]|uniref:Uncharacterized protein n=1 Tax=Conoideocrella luteorostrata TaxID=1105319 RepID=A0AAJ0CIC7_9HYPO|nr:hypothetical protein QQS21_009948 [Conoideocrella luteorostrata]